MVQGKGTVRDGKGNQYQGGFEGGLKSGSGMMIFSNGCVYEVCSFVYNIFFFLFFFFFSILISHKKGGFYNGLRHGKTSRFIIPTGVEYVGGYLRGKMNGPGILTVPCCKIPEIAPLKGNNEGVGSSPVLGSVGGGGGEGRGGGGGDEGSEKWMFEGVWEGGMKEGKFNVTSSGKSDPVTVIFRQNIPVGGEAGRGGGEGEGSTWEKTSSGEIGLLLGVLRYLGSGVVDTMWRDGLEGMPGGCPF